MRVIPGRRQVAALGCTQEESMCAPATSPSLMSLMRAPASRHCLMRSACLGRSRMHAVTSLWRKARAPVDTFHRKGKEIA